jgi:hypothetical protein
VQSAPGPLRSFSHRRDPATGCRQRDKDAASTPCLCQRGPPRWCPRSPSRDRRITVSRANVVDEARRTLYGRSTIKTWDEGTRPRRLLGQPAAAAARWHCPTDGAVRMPSSRKSRAAKPARPAADATCRKSRTVTRRKVQLDVWTCSAPQPGEPLDRDLPPVKMAPIVWRVGRRNWRRRNWRSGTSAAPKRRAATRPRASRAGTSAP